MADRRRPASTSRPPGPRSAPGIDRERLLAVLEPVVAQARLDLEDVEVRTAGRRRIVRVLVDGENGVSLDEVADGDDPLVLDSIAALSRYASDVLDRIDTLPYVLEVTSPGVDRPLTLPRHWRRNRGRLVRVVLAGGEEVTGRIVTVDDAGVELGLDPGTRRIAYEGVGRAVVQVEFRAPDDAGVDEEQGG